MTSTAVKTALKPLLKRVVSLGLAPLDYYFLVSSVDDLRTGHEEIDETVKQGKAELKERLRTEAIVQEEYDAFVQKIVKDAGGQHTLVTTKGILNVGSMAFFTAGGSAGLLGAGATAVGSGLSMASVVSGGAVGTTALSSAGAGVTAFAGVSGALGGLLMGGMLAFMSIEHFLTKSKDTYEKEMWADDTSYGFGVTHEQALLARKNLYHKGKLREGYAVVDSYLVDFKKMLRGVMIARVNTSSDFGYFVDEMYQQLSWVGGAEAGEGDPYENMRKAYHPGRIDWVEDRRLRFLSLYVHEQLIPVKVYEAISLALSAAFQILYEKLPTAYDSVRRRSLGSPQLNALFFDMYRLRQQYASGGEGAKGYFAVGCYKLLAGSGKTSAYTSPVLVFSTIQKQQLLKKFRVVDADTPQSLLEKGRKAIHQTTFNDRMTAFLDFLLDERSPWSMEKRARFYYYQMKPNMDEKFYDTMAAILHSYVYMDPSILDTFVLATYPPSTYGDSRTYLDRAYSRAHKEGGWPLDKSQYFFAGR